MELANSLLSGFPLHAPCMFARNSSTMTSSHTAEPDQPSAAACYAGPMHGTDSLDARTRFATPRQLLSGVGGQP